MTEGMNRATQRRGVAVVDLGGTRLRTAIFSVDGDLVDKRVIPTPVGRPSALGEALCSHIASVDLQVDAAVVGVPGPVSYASGRPLELPNLPGWAEALSEEGLRRALGLHVTIAHDADLAALGEHAFGAGRGTDDMAYLTISTGIGAGIVLGGQLLHGRRSLAEIGRVPVGPSDVDSIEGLASGSALLRLTGWTGEELAGRAREHDPVATEAIETAGQALAIGAVTLAACFTPQRLVIGGGLGLGAADLLLPPARQRLEAMAWAFRPPEVRLAELGDDVGLRGGFAYWSAAHGKAAA